MPPAPRSATMTGHLASARSSRVGALTQSRLARIREPPWRGAHDPGSLSGNPHYLRSTLPRTRGFSVATAAFCLLLIAARLATIGTGAPDPEPGPRCRLPGGSARILFNPGTKEQGFSVAAGLRLPASRGYGRTVAMKSALLFLLVAPIAAAQAPLRNPAGHARTLPRRPSSRADPRPRSIPRDFGVGVDETYEVVGHAMPSPSLGHGLRPHRAAPISHGRDRPLARRAR